MASNFGYDDCLQNKFNSDPQKVLKKFKYNDGNSIFERIDNLDGFDSPELNDIINMIVLWKINRTPYVDDETLEQLQNISSIDSKEEVFNEENYNNAKNLLTNLLGCKGVKLPVASTMLHFFNKECFPIIDQRAYRVIYGKDYNDKDYKEGKSVKKYVELYFDYLNKCIDYCDNHLNGVIPFSEIDKYLYQIDKELKNKVKY